MPVELPDLTGRSLVEEGCVRDQDCKTCLLLNDFTGIAILPIPVRAGRIGNLSSQAPTLGA